MTKAPELWEEISTLIHDVVCGCTHGDAGDGAFVRNGDEVAKQVVELIKEHDLRPVVKPLEWEKGEFKLTDGNTYTSTAHTPFGRYYASELIWFGPGVVIGHGNSETNCQEYAQDTYEVLVNSTLDLAPVTPAQAAKVLLEMDDYMPVSARVAAVKAYTLREGKVRPITVAEGWRAALRAIAEGGA